MGATERLRPILMTACAMTVGMVPMALALERGSQMEAPLGRAVIGGLVMSTFATLLVLPSIFAVVIGSKQASSPSLYPANPASAHYDPAAFGDSSGNDHEEDGGDVQEHGGRATGSSRLSGTWELRDGAARPITDCTGDEDCDPPTGPTSRWIALRRCFVELVALGIAGSDRLLQARKDGPQRLGASRHCKWSIPSCERSFAWSASRASPKAMNAHRSIPR